MLLLLLLAEAKEILVSAVLARRSRTTKETMGSGRQFGGSSGLEAHVEVIRCSESSSTSLNRVVSSMCPQKTANQEREEKEGGHEPQYIYCFW